VGLFTPNCSVDEINVSDAVYNAFYVMNKVAKEGALVFFPSCSVPSVVENGVVGPSTLEKSHFEKLRNIFSMVLSHSIKASYDGCGSPSYMATSLFACTTLRKTIN